MRFRTFRFALSLTVVVAFVLATGPLAAQQAPPSWKQGQPKDMESSSLSPIAQPPAPKAPGEIPVDKIKVPSGFKVELWAHGINNARAMADPVGLFTGVAVVTALVLVIDAGLERVQAQSLAWRPLSRDVAV